MKFYHPLVPNATTQKEKLNPSWVANTKLIPSGSIGATLTRAISPILDESDGGIEGAMLVLVLSSWCLLCSNEFLQKLFYIEANIDFVVMLANIVGRARYSSSIVLVLDT